VRRLTPQGEALSGFVVRGHPVRRMREETGVAGEADIVEEARIDEGLHEEGRDRLRLNDRPLFEFMKLLFTQSKTTHHN
jgi:hypothetical protein